MQTKLAYFFGLAALLTATSAAAAPNCLKGPTPYRLDNDTVNWGMTIAPGSDCIQGLRWSYMQIYQAELLKAPQAGRVVMVGSGFRYYANPASPSVADTFTIEVFGKNRRVLGRSIVEIKVGAVRSYMDSSLIELCEACTVRPNIQFSELAPGIDHFLD